MLSGKYYGVDIDVWVRTRPRTIGTRLAQSHAMPSRSRDRAESIPGLPGAPRPDPGCESQNGLKNKDSFLLKRNKPIFLLFSFFKVLKHFMLLKIII